MRVLGSTIVPRVLLGISGFLMLLLAVGCVQSLLADGPSANSAFMLVFALLVAVLCFSVVAGVADVGWDN